ncbi:MAG: hypothetical protein ACI85O_000349 [Saprospiraceae bacterium]|jgi:hypothetical protein
MAKNDLDLSSLKKIAVKKTRPVPVYVEQSEVTEMEAVVTKIRREAQQKSKGIIKRISLDVPIEIYKQIKISATENNETMKQFILSAVRKQL